MENIPSAVALGQFRNIGGLKADLINSWPIKSASTLLVTIIAIIDLHYWMLDTRRWKHKKVEISIKVSANNLCTYWLQRKYTNFIIEKSCRCHHHQVINLISLVIGQIDIMCFPIWHPETTNQNTKSEYNHEEISEKPKLRFCIHINVKVLKNKERLKT